MVFLVLAAQYESWAVPFAVLLAVPFGVFGALSAVWAMGMSNDIYFQIGLVTLIGLSAKNAILIVEFANKRYEAGHSLVDAAMEAAKIRFRPIVMTSMAFILGVVPLVLASGAGAASRNSIGTGVFGGMLAATFLAIFFVPLFFVLVRKLSRRGTGSATPRPGTGAIPLGIRRRRVICVASSSQSCRVLLLACAMGPDYSRPDIPTSDSFRMAEEPKDLPSLANMPWWELYRDEELQHLIRIALEENKDLKRAVAQYRRIPGAPVHRSNGLCPSIERDGQSSHRSALADVAFPGFPRPFAIMCKESLAWELDIWGRIRRSNEAAWRISWLGRRTDEPSLCKSWAEWRRRISIFGNSTCSWRSRSARCWHGKSR